jgi:predicted protein tyrosine phosphatase
MNFDCHSQPESAGIEPSTRRVHALFVCGPGRMRSLTAEQVFATRADLRVAAAGVDSRAEHAVSAQLVQWADVVFVMEDVQRDKLVQRFGEALRGKQIVSLGIPDRYEYMDPQLIRLLKTATVPYLG